MPSEVNLDAGNKGSGADCSGYSTRGGQEIEPGNASEENLDDHLVWNNSKRHTAEGCAHSFLHHANASLNLWNMFIICYCGEDDLVVG